MSQHIVESVVVHLVSDLLDHALTGRYDVLIHDVGLFVLEHGEFRFGVEYKVFAGTLLPPGDVLNAESVRVVPREENIPNDIFHAFPRELQFFSPNYRTIAEIQSACICAMCLCNPKWVRVILLGF